MKIPSPLSLFLLLFNTDIFRLQNYQNIRNRPRAFTAKDGQQIDQSYCVNVTRSNPSYIIKDGSYLGITNRRQWRQGSIWDRSKTANISAGISPIQMQCKVTAPRSRQHFPHRRPFLPTTLRIYLRKSFRLDPWSNRLKYIKQSIFIYKSNYRKNTMPFYIKNNVLKMRALIG